MRIWVIRHGMVVCWLEAFWSESVLAWVFITYSSFLPQSKNMHVRLICESIFPWERVCIFLFNLLFPCGALRWLATCLGCTLSLVQLQFGWQIWPHLWCFSSLVRHSKCFKQQATFTFHPVILVVPLMSPLEILHLVNICIFSSDQSWYVNAATTFDMGLRWKSTEHLLTLHTSDLFIYSNFCFCLWRKRERF